jgi:hypothetical protein
MYARSTTLGILGAIALALPLPSGPTFTLQSTGAVRITVVGHEARYGVVSPEVSGRPILALSLGATTGAGALQVAMPGDRAPMPGRHPIRSSWDGTESDPDSFHASFMAGTAEHPLGWFHGESGWVEIAKTGAGRIAGTFEIRAHGFVGADPAGEDQWVTVRGSFDAEGDSTVATIASVQ